MALFQTKVMEHCKEVAVLCVYTFVFFSCLNKDIIFLRTFTSTTIYTSTFTSTTTTTTSTITTAITTTTTCLPSKTKYASKYRSWQRLVRLHLSDLV